MSRSMLVVLLVMTAAVAVVSAATAGGLALSRRSVRRRLAGLTARLTSDVMAGAAGTTNRGTPAGMAGAGPAPGAAPETADGAAGSASPGPASPGPANPETSDDRYPVDLANEGGGLEATLERLAQGAGVATEAVTAAGEDTVRLRHALDAMPQGVVVCDEDGEVRFRNASAEAMIGSRHADALAARAVEELLAVSAGGAPAERTLELYGPPRRTLTVRTQPIDNQYRSLGVLAVLDDVSERRRLESVRRDFVANMSHELKTPVGALGLLAETLSAEPDREVARRLADRIQTEAFRVGRIIDDLLDLSRIEAQESPPREPVDVALVMAEAMERVRQTADSSRVGLVLEEPPAPLVVLGDRRQLVSALNNLLENAVKYSDGGSVVSLTGRAIAGWVDLVVRDHGIGIPARDLERIFERFYRVDQGRSRQTGGTGLGLAIVRHVAHNHGGRVWVESREGEGSTFTLRVPLRLSGPPIGDQAGAPQR